MKSIEKPFSIKTIFWITNISFWIYVAISAFAALLGIGFIIGFFNEANLHVGIPVGVNLVEQGVLNINNTETIVQFKEMFGKINFVDTPVFIGRVYGVFMIAIVIMFLYIFSIFRKFIQTIYRGDYFDSKNIALLKKIAYTLVGIWFFTVFYSYFQYFYLVKNIDYPNIQFSGNIEFYPIILLVALFIWVLSHIFEKGCELQEERKLTI